MNTVFLAPSWRFTNKSDVLEVVICGAQATAQLTAEVSDYNAQVCDGTYMYLLLYKYAGTESHLYNLCNRVGFFSALI